MAAEASSGTAAASADVDAATPSSPSVRPLPPSAVTMAPVHWRRQLLAQGYVGPFEDNPWDAGGSSSSVSGHSRRQPASNTRRQRLAAMRSVEKLAQEGFFEHDESEERDGAGHAFCKALVGATSSEACVGRSPTTPRSGLMQGAASRGLRAPSPHPPPQSSPRSPHASAAAHGAGAPRATDGLPTSPRPVGGGGSPPSAPHVPRPPPKPREGAAVCARPLTPGSGMPSRLGHGVGGRRPGKDAASGAASAHVSRPCAPLAPASARPSSRSGFSRPASVRCGGAS